MILQVRNICDSIPVNQENEPNSSKPTLPLHIGWFEPKRSLCQHQSVRAARPWVNSSSTVVSERHRWENRSIALAVVLGGLLVSAGLAQTPAALEAHFEGTHVQVKMDMPGDSNGVDVWPHRDIPVDFTEVGNRLRNFGVALRKGDSVMVTKIRVKKKLIEFQLGGGGYTGWAGIPYISTHVPKSRREKKLDDLIKNETDKKRKKRLKAERRDLRDERRHAEDHLRAAVAQAEMLAEHGERELRATSGSRFNLRFIGPVPDEFLRSEVLAAALADYVDFGDGGTGAPLQPASDFPLYKGMSAAEVEAVFGPPSDRAMETAAGFEMERHVHELGEATLTVHYVDGVLVKYVLESRGARCRRPGS